MAQSKDIPQEIIDKIIAAVGNDKFSLQRCALVSSSFLRPSRKQLFSRIKLKDYTCQRLHQFLVQNPDIQSFVRKIELIDSFEFSDFDRPEYEWLNGASLLAILRLPFSCLEGFSIRLNLNPYDLKYWSWKGFNSEMRDALSNIIHSSNLKTLSLEGITDLPITFFLHIVHLRTLELHLLSPDDFGNKKSSSLISKKVASIASHTVIDRCVWRLRTDYVYDSFTKSVCLPFMGRLRSIEIYVTLHSATIRDFEILSLLMDSVCISLTSPAILERLKFKIRWRCNSGNKLDCSAFYEDLRHADVWSHLDSITSHPAGSRLQRVNIIINYSFCHDDTDSETEGAPDDGNGPDEVEVLEAVLDGLPLLCAKDILLVKAESGHAYAMHKPGMKGSAE